MASDKRHASVEYLSKFDPDLENVNSRIHEILSNLGFSRLLLELETELQELNKGEREC